MTNAKKTWLETERLIVREYDAIDKEALQQGIGNLNISKYLLVVPHPYTTSDGDFWIDHCAKEQAQNPRASYDLAIELKTGSKFIGGIGFSKVDHYQGTAEIGYWLAEPYWGKGFMSEALERMTRFGFEDLALRRINLNAFTENEGSNHLAQKFGYTLEGMKRKAVRCKASGKIHDENMYGLLKEDWEKRR